MRADGQTVRVRVQVGSCTIGRAGRVVTDALGSDEGYGDVDTTLGVGIDCG